MTNTNAKKLLADLQKVYGEDQVMMASQIPVGPPVSSGSLALDVATGYGGFPINRVVEIYGKEGTGKTTLALMAMVNALEKYPDRAAVFLDIEHKITPDWVEMIVGKELMENRVIYLQPTSIERATNMYRKAVETDQVCCAILDSIGGAPTVRANEDAEVALVGGNAIGVGTWSRAAAPLAAVHHCLTIGINQVRANMNPRAFADDTPGGRAWRHAAILRIELVRGRETEHEVINGEKVPIGYNVFAKIRKNQVGPEGRTAMYWFHHVWTPEHGFGIDRADEATRLSIATQVVTKSGGWYHHPALDGGKVQGLPKLIEAIKGDPALCATITTAVRDRLAEHVSEIAPMSDPEIPTEQIAGMESLYVNGVGE